MVVPFYFNILYNISFYFNIYLNTLFRSCNEGAAGRQGTVPNNQRNINKNSQSSLSEIRRSPQATNTTSATTTTTTAASPEPQCSDPRQGKSCFYIVSYLFITW